MYVHLYTYDLLLGKEPYLNFTGICSREFSNEEHFKAWVKFDQEMESGDQINTKQTKNPSLKNTENTIGLYQNLAYGNLTVYRNATDQEIYMSYGPLAYWRLERTGEDLTFTGRATLPFWNLSVQTIEFKECDSQLCASVTPSFDAVAPPTFYRNLGPEPNPEPPCPIT